MSALAGGRATSDPALDSARQPAATGPAITARCVLTLFALGCLVLGILVLHHDGAGSRHPATSGVPARTYHQEALLSLPAAARGPVSAALGGNSKAYRVLSAAGGLRAANSAQNLSVSFNAKGVSVSSGDGRLGLALRGVGYGTRLGSVGPSLPHAAANRVSYAPGRGVREWYANGPLGLEQGFDLASRPRAGSGPLTLSLSLTGDMHARLSAGGVTFSDGGIALRYDQLSVSDARGRRLRAWFALRRGRVLIKVADRGARYPLRIDPFVQQAELAASDGAVGDLLGTSVAVSGSTIVVGAPHHTVGSNYYYQGAAYVFSNSSGTWKQTAELTASDGAGSEEFGFSVAVSGTTVAVGAPHHAVGSNLYQGAVYVFSNAGGGWTQSAELTASDGFYGEEFGSSVAVSGNTIVVGESFDDLQGAAYVFSDAGGGWTQTAELTASDGAANEEFGSSVAVSGSTIAIGAPGIAVYVFSDAGGGWTQSGELDASDGGTSDGLADLVAVSGTTIVVGAPLHNVGSNQWQGAVYVYGNGEQDVSGTVYGQSCSSKTCSLPGGIGGFTVLVKGTASDGTAVSETDVSDADDGSWSVQVPAGTYMAGLSSDGTTFVSEAMERPVTVTNAPVTGVNFTSCAESTTGSAAQGSATRALASRALVGGGSRAGAEDGSFTPSYCDSEYTLKLTAKIPQEIVVDASKNAHFNTTSDNGPSGYNHSPSFINALRGFFRDKSGFNQEYPDCLAPGKVALYTQQNATAEWYSYIEAGKVIATATVKLIWNQSTHKAEVAGPPTDTTVSLTRKFAYRVHFPSGRTLDGACFDRAKVPMLLAVQPIGNNNEGASAKTAREEEGGDSNSAPFTIEAGLWFPFDAYGATIDPDTTWGEKLIDAGSSLARNLFKGATALSEKYERLPAYGKFLIETGANLVIGLAEEKVAIAALGKTAEWYHEYSTGTKLTAEELEKLELIGTVKGASELLATVPLEAYNMYAGYFGYPVMSAVIRGQFKTVKYLDSAEAFGTPKKMPYETTLAVSVSTTKFPTWSLKISRDALNTCLSGCKVWEGPLPWKSDPTGEPETFNPFSLKNRAYVVQNSAKTGKSYTSGEKAVSNVLDDTRQNLELAFGIRHKGSITSNFGAAEEEVPTPSCDADTGRSNSPETICWLFSDWRP